MDKNKLFGEKKFFKELGVCAPWKKFGQKNQNLEIFFDIIDNHTCVHLHVKKYFEIFRFSAKFFDFLKGPPVEFFLDRFFSTVMHSETKFYIDLRCFLTFGLEPLPRELCLIKSSFMKHQTLLRTHCACAICRLHLTE